MATIAFIGLGRMGRPMALRLRGAGYGLRCFDTDPAAIAPLAEAGATGAATVTEAVREVDAVITMLPDGAAVRDVMLGAPGGAAAMRQGAMLIDMGSSAPLGTRALGEALAARGLAMIDAPVSGGVAKAENGTLAIMAGGAAEHVSAARPVLDVMGQTVLHVGPIGSGHAAKALNNYVSAAGLVAACEALIVADAFGIDTATLVDVLNASTGRNNSTEVKMKQQIISERFGSGFAMALMSKDLDTAAGLAARLGCAQPGMRDQNGLWSEALSRLGTGADHTEIFRFLRERAAGRGAVWGAPE